MKLSRLLVIAAILLPSSVFSQHNISGMWVLNGPDTESEILLTAEGERLRSEYDLLVDDPSLSCVPASTARIWANPGSRILIEQHEGEILISYELFDLRRKIPMGDETALTDQPSTQNLSGSFFQEMGSSFAKAERDYVLIQSQKHSFGYIRTSRGIPQSSNTVATEELRVEGDNLTIKHTYTDAALFHQPLVLEYSFIRVDETEIAIYDCTDSDYDWFLELNAKKEKPQ